MARSERRRAVSLQRALAYENVGVIERFRKTFAVRAGVAEQLFDDLKRWLWISAHPARPPIFAIDDRLYALDEMWHTFIVFTRDYREYCGMLGYFCDHYPTTEADLRADALARRQDPDWARKGAEQRRAQYEFIRAKLGEETLQRWYLTYPRRLSKERLEAVRIVADGKPPAGGRARERRADTGARSRRVGRGPRSGAAV